jgi:hypothetical protein
LHNREGEEKEEKPDEEEEKCFNDNHHHVLNSNLKATGREWKESEMEKDQNETVEKKFFA